MTTAALNDDGNDNTDDADDDDDKDDETPAQISGRSLISDPVVATFLPGAFAELLLGHHLLVAVELDLERFQHQIGHRPTILRAWMR